jgi:5-bromo-4-chloroindolyl phosphate hydrolysis protein
MAQRFGGKYSPAGNRQTPDGPDAERPMAQPAPRASSDQRRAGLLGFLALAFLIPGFQGDQRQLILSLVAGGVLLLSAVVTREGVKAQEAFDARNVARRPALPRKVLGALLAAAALTVGGLIHSTGLLYPGLFGLAGFVLHLFAFGPDPMADKGMAGIDPFQTDRVARAVDEAEAYLNAMKDAILRAGDRSLEGRVEKFTLIARSLFRSVEADPGDLTAARKFLSVYLMGARDATVKFADLYAHNRDPKARADYEALLTDLETTFAQRTTALLSNGHTDLDVEISVLRDRLKLEN